MFLGLAAAPIFPLFTLTTGTTRMVSLQVAASAVGGAALPAGLGLLLGAAGPRLLAPALLALGLAMGAACTRSSGHPDDRHPGSRAWLVHRGQGPARRRSSSITSPISRPGRSVPSATIASMAG